MRQLWDAAVEAAGRSEDPSKSEIFDVPDQGFGCGFKKLQRAIFSHINGLRVKGLAKRARLALPFTDPRAVTFLESRKKPFSNCLLSSMLPQGTEFTNQIRRSNPGPLSLPQLRDEDFRQRKDHGRCIRLQHQKLRSGQRGQGGGLSARAAPCDEQDLADGSVGQHLRARWEGGTQDHMWTRSTGRRCSCVSTLGRHLRGWLRGTLRGARLRKCKGGGGAVNPGGDPRPHHRRQRPRLERQQAHRAHPDGGRQMPRPHVQRDPRTSRGSLARCWPSIRQMWTAST